MNQIRKNDDKKKKFKVSKISFEDDVEVIYHYKQTPKDGMALQKLAPIFYFCTYKCKRCGHEWNYCGTNPPLDEVPCLINICSKPSFITFLFRLLMKQKINGIGKLIRVKVDAWK